MFSVFLATASPHLVGMTRTLSDASMKAWKSAGEPRRVPGTNSFTPRSSTHMPQFTQSTLRPFFAASASWAATSSIRNAVVRFSDSYGGSMSAMVSVVLDMLGLLVPEGLVAGRAVVHDHVDGGRRDSLGQLGDAALLQRE